MAKPKAEEAIDTTAGVRAYALAQQHQAALEPRLPAGLMEELATALRVLGADPRVPAAPPGALPPLAAATARAGKLIKAVHAAVAGAKPSAEASCGYGISPRWPGSDAQTIAAAGAMIVARAREYPSEALSLGILPADVTAVEQAMAALEAAKIAAQGTPETATKKDRQEAAARIADAVARIAGAGMLAFALDDEESAAFEGLRGT
jgi:hypothetical protein